MKEIRFQITLLIAITWLFNAGTSPAAHAYRDFSSTNGCTIRGTLLDYEIGNQIATILRQGRKDPCRAHITVFGEADRTYIRTWAAEQDFRTSLKISARLVDVPGRKDMRNKRYDPQYIRCQAYEVTLDNRSDTAFVQVAVEYCIFYTQTERDESERIFHDGVLFGRMGAGAMAAGYRQDLKTESVSICDEVREVNLFGSDAGFSGQVDGVWLRLTATLPSGEKVVRDQCFPDDLQDSRSWTTTSKTTELNRKSGRSEMPYTGIAPVKLPKAIRISLN